MENNQMRIIKMILVLNPKVTAGNAAIAYKALKELETKR